MTNLSGMNLLPNLDEERFRLVVEAAPNAMLMTDAHGRIVLVNNQTERLFGYSRDELIGSPIENLLPMRNRASHPDLVRKYVADPEARPMGVGRDLAGLHKDGREIPVEIGLSAIETSDGLFILASIIDISLRVGAEAYLRGLSRRLSLALQAGQLGVWQWNIQTGRLDWDARTFEIFGVPVGSLTEYEQWRNIVHPEDLERVEAELAQSLASRNPAKIRYRIHHPVNGIRFVEASSEISVDTRNTLVACVGVLQDVTERRQMEEELRLHAVEMERLSMTDPLTGVGNRRCLDVRLGEEAQVIRRYGGSCSVIFADLDHFKRVNDQFGHVVGDEILRSFATVLRSHTRDSDLIARFGGEEFVLLLPHTDIDAASALAERIRRMLEANTIPPLTWSITASFGVAELREDGTTMNLLQRADEALYRAKRGGRNQIARG